jgi:hypothetical protein
MGYYQNGYARLDYRCRWIDHLVDFEHRSYESYNLCWYKRGGFFVESSAG